METTENSERGRPLAVPLSDLLGRLEAHACMHDDMVPHDAEQAQFAAELRAAAYWLASEVSNADNMRLQVADLSAAVARLQRLLREVSDETRHPDYEWPLFLRHEVSVALEQKA